jgi:hypothetical protein
MPFEQVTPRQFTPGGVRAYAPSASGVYGISNAREWIYVGSADNIQGALLEHLQDVNTPLMKRQPLGFVFEICDRASRPARQTRLVSEYGPVCNRPASRYS